MSTNKNVLITGGAGRLARYTIDYLLERNYRVTAFDMVTPDPDSFPKGVPFVKGNLTSLEDNMRALHLSGADAIVHLGAITHDTSLQPGRSRIQRMPEDETMRVNTMGTYYLMDAARRFHVKTVVAASSYYVLGLGFRISDRPFRVHYLPIDEEHPLQPEDSYSLSKLINEETLKAFGLAYGIRTVAFRLNGVDYPFQRDTYKYNITPEARPNHTGGPIGTTHQYIDPRDAAQAFALALEATNLELFEAFYLHTDSRHWEDTKTVVERHWPDLKELAGHLEGTDGVITGRKLREKLGYEPKYSWRNPPHDF
ncbi:dTDP-4-dehydro-6-deoxyglucose reductase [Paenibacillus konkukensis]|uniref:dTDP-4-dehydro-6-deoxyglucose reductase n=1 Tax=Paenibacillus konkukensis TaxID=2020716 RepID=A0ABY4RHV6_9BACL|nr:NAD(P)-dependent oxidoreductase [Paenibacillus konkukensis]UQZ81103.1 dTDP-4-dehydro-6-deoxyglucose reductase [Paenibacillus konkukensis]